jgi:hypothetical protein
MLQGLKCEEHYVRDGVHRALSASVFKQFVVRREIRDASAPAVSTRGDISGAATGLKNFDTCLINARAFAANSIRAL